MNEARVIRRRSFRARHHYARPEWSDERNRAAFGDQTKSHEHDWLLEVRVTGPVDEDTGFSIDLDGLDTMLDELTGEWDGGDLTQLIPEVAAGAILPTTEALARWVFERLGPRISAPTRLERVAVFESQELGSEYPA